MGKFDGILIISDVDSTFLGKKSRLVPENLEAIKYFEDEGGLFTFASGRMHGNLYRVIPEPEKIANVPAVMSNGAYIYDFAGKEILLPRYMDGDTAYDAMRYVRENYPGTGIRVSQGDGFLTDVMTEYITHDLERSFMHIVNVRPMEEWAEIKDDWFKIVIRDKSEILDEIREKLIANYPDKFELSKSAPTFLEIQSKGCNKAAKIAELRAWLEEKAGRKLTLCACGDYENDLPMLKTADITGCPANALDDVKETCDVTLCHCDDGFIADFIRWLETRV